MRAELKYKDITSADSATLGSRITKFSGDVAAGSPGTVLQLVNGLTAGNSPSGGIIGSKATFRTWNFKAEICAQNASAPISGVAYRLALVVDKQPNAAAPAWSDIWKTTPGTPTTFNAIEAQLNLDNRDRFVVLWDKEGVLFPSSSICTRTLKKFMKIPSAYGTPQYTATPDGTISSIKTYSYFLVMWTDGTSAGNSDLAIKYQSRLRYTDA